MQSSGKTAISGSDKWLLTDVKDINPTGRHFLETYSKIPSKEVLPHVLAIRDKAFALYQWPCIGQMRFLQFRIASYPAYTTALERLKNDPKSQYLDLGSCFGQDIRQLYIDGVKPSQLVGLDLVPEFNQLGYELFRDANMFQFEFFPRDIMDDTADWKPLEGRFDVLHLSSFLHIWKWEGQVKATMRVASFTKPGSILVGSGLGSRAGGEFPNLEGTGTNFRQSEESIRRLFAEVGEKTNTKWQVTSSFKPMEATATDTHQVWAEPDMGITEFKVVRTE